MQRQGTLQTYVLTYIAMHAAHWLSFSINFRSILEFCAIINHPCFLHSGVCNFLHMSFLCHHQPCSPSFEWPSLNFPPIKTLSKTYYTTFHHTITIPAYRTRFVRSPPAVINLNSFQSMKHTIDTSIDAVAALWIRPALASCFLAISRVHIDWWTSISHWRRYRWWRRPRLHRKSHHTSIFPHIGTDWYIHFPNILRHTFSGLKKSISACRRVWFRPVGWWSSHGIHPLTAGYCCRCCCLTLQLWLPRFGGWEQSAAGRMGGTHTSAAPRFFLYDLRTAY